MGMVFGCWVASNDVMGISPFSAACPVRVGIVGTGYAAKLRAETLQTDERATLVAVVGHTLEKTKSFSQTYAAEAVISWQQLLQRSDLDLVIVSTINRDHGAIARAALETGKHVIVEYPLSLDVVEAEQLISLAQDQGKLLHVEHIELLGGLHRGLKQSLPAIGNVFHARYSTINPQRPAPSKWTYHPELFGFPLSGAISRIHRLTDLFGKVKSVSCLASFEPTVTEFYKTCLCTAQLSFTSGLMAEVTYGKGESIWQNERKFEVHGEKGALIFDGDVGSLIQADTTKPIEVGARRGLFALDTAMVLDHLFIGTPLYVTPAASLYALKVADAAHRSAQTGQTITLNE